MSLTVETLREQLATTEQELENARAHVYRCDGCIQLLKHLLTLAETEEPETPAASVNA
mgnify:FL=1